MKNIYTALTAGAMVLGGTISAYAVTPAMQQAIDIDACDSRPIVGARFLADQNGRLEVTCSAGALSGAGMNSTAALAAGAGVLILWAIMNDDDDTTTTTTTASGS